MREGGFYESGVSAYQMMLPIFQVFYRTLTPFTRPFPLPHSQETGDYAKQRKCYQDLVDLTGILLDEEQIKQRIFSNYYRVAFFGKKLLDLDGKEFIYKELNTTMLAQFTDKILVRTAL